MWSRENPTERLLLELVDRIETREYGLLAWGFLDGAFTQNELTTLAEETIRDLNVPGESRALLRELEKRRLLYPLPGEEDRYRSRFAESVRLFARLRQIFRANQWETAPRLVADYRLLSRARRYPKRDIPPADALMDLQRGRPLTQVEEEAFLAMTGSLQGLSRFQVEAAWKQLNPPPDPTSGTIVSAGTGTGKTLAFYLPALMMIAERMDPERFWTQALALYPRKELLKDQFTEAFSRARMLDGVTQQRRGRKIRLATYFGDTPNSADAAELAEKKWPQRHGGYVCLFLRCPKCEGDMVWKQEDLADRRERLHCVRSGCGTQTQEDELILTRRRMRLTPPDLLFTTAEMLNQRMNSGYDRHLFGIGRKCQRPPWVMLLDEVHTYTGPHGAQVALLVRRWRNAVRAPVQFVGLSATLADPQGFFAQLVGLEPTGVAPVAPQGPMDEEGREYLLALRGDPVSGASLLSTSIQASMLLGRIMDPIKGGRSGKAYGSKVFVFTDDLDVTNRLYHDLLDAEARSTYNGRENFSRPPLAAHRYSQLPRPAQRFQEGQNWHLCEWIDHSLVPQSAERLNVGRTSSQDAGVDSNAQVVVATASLEVGFDDPNVGGVIQHKAPRDPASFLQRKGRAGRNRSARPWTVAVLSDFGRDRLAYQAYEHLFDPVLERPALPTGNRYVLRMQAVYAFMDWMADRFPRDLEHGGSVWQDLSQPGEDGPQGTPRQQHAAKVIGRLLQEADLRQELEEHLKYTLKIPAQEVKALLWEPPRALMTAVLPTLLRRLQTGWRRVEEGVGCPGRDFLVDPDPAAKRQRRNPLPEFIPQNLFSELNVPEVTVITPRPWGTEKDSHNVPITQVLRFLPPGRVTRRFGVHHRSASHWFPLRNLTDLRQEIPVSDYCQGENLGAFEVQSGNQVVPVHTVRPYHIEAALCPDGVKISSNAQPDWRSQIFSMEKGLPRALPEGSLFGDLVGGVTFYTHNQQMPLRVRRFSLGSNAVLRLKSGEERVVHVRFTGPDGQRAAVGFEQEVDGIRFDCRLPQDLLARAAEREALRAGRIAFFRHRVAADAELRRHANEDSFRLDFLAQVFLSILLARALRGEVTLQQAVEDYRTRDWSRTVQFTMEVMFQTLAGDQDEEADEDTPVDDDGASGPGGRNYREVRALLGEAEVRARLFELAATLWETPGAEWDAWLRKRLKAAIGGALLQACYQTAHSFQAGDLCLDLERTPCPDYAVAAPADLEPIWITETVIGGGGVIEEILRQYTEDPRRFYLLAEMALQPTDLEVVDAELTRVVGLVQRDAGLSQAFDRVRTAHTNAELTQARNGVMTALRERNVLLSHPVLTSLNARVLRPGTSLNSDRLLHVLLERWQAEEERLGVEIDPRIFTYLTAAVPQLRDAVIALLQEVNGDADADLKRVYQVVYGLLWPRGSILRERALEAYNAFSPVPASDPRLILQQLQSRLEYISLADPDWQDRAERALREQGVARLRVGPEARAALASALLELSRQAIESGFLRLYPYVARMERLEQDTAVILHLREAVQ